VLWGGGRGVVKTCRCAGVELRLGSSRRYSSEDELICEMDEWVFLWAVYTAWVLQPLFLCPVCPGERFWLIFPEGDVY